MAVIPYYTPTPLLPSWLLSDLTRDCERLDISGFDAQRIGGITMSGTIAIPAQAFATPNMIYMVCPNNIVTANQSSTGSGAYPRLVIASVPVNNVADVMTFTWSMSQTKTGASRTFTSTCSFASGLPSQSYTGTWSDSTTPIIAFRVRAVNQTNYTTTGQNVFLEAIPSGFGGGLSSYTASALGNP